MDYANANKKFSVLPQEKLQLFSNLGIVTVPDDYVNEKALDSLNRDDFFSLNENISDKNFPNQALRPGDKFKVFAVKHPHDEHVTSEEIANFLAGKKAVYVGAQGLLLVYKERKINLIGKGYRYVSFDEKPNLWQNSKGDHMVPTLEAGTSRNFKWGLVPFRKGLGINDVLLVFIPE